MKYLGIVKSEKDKMILPDNFVKEVVSLQGEEPLLYEAIEIEGMIVLMNSPINRNRLALIEDLTQKSIQEHRTSLDGLAH